MSDPARRHLDSTAWWWRPEQIAAAMAGNPTLRAYLGFMAPASAPDARRWTAPTRQALLYAAWLYELGVRLDPEAFGPCGPLHLEPSAVVEHVMTMLHPGGVITPAVDPEQPGALHRYIAAALCDAPAVIAEGEGLHPDDDYTAPVYLADKRNPRRRARRWVAINRTASVESVLEALRRNEALRLPAGLSDRSLRGWIRQQVATVPEQPLPKGPAGGERRRPVPWQWFESLDMEIARPANETAPQPLRTARHHTSKLWGEVRVILGRGWLPELGKIRPKVRN